MGPIFWGIILFFIGLVGWVTFSVVGALEKFTTAKLSSITLIYFFGLTFFFSLPIAILLEIVKWIKTKRKTK
ncbi:hypothetical protein Arcpr_1405 [Archaeoglobus profundus DSM 5631]|uniref:Uncharacterized protein n=1 Tax=Archaeoglobus profundus (strain DSM 5631 / JCM 9629 / NBRC 100127 / Av18) TaxID=572546 RepID=D2REB0_ARCPA|nr:hypothetical protein Arcpr_1405 [Archaeoglobus profundus DSM 5631]